MKRILMAGFMLGALSLTNCTKDIDENPHTGIETPEKTYAFTAALDESRTIYEPGTGIRLTGDEQVGVVYTTKDAAGTIAAVKSGKQVATPVEGQKLVYNFTAPALADGLSVAQYFFVLPNGIETRGTATENSLALLLPTIQCPQNHQSFDSDADILIGKPQTPEMIENGDATILFKRLFTPVKLVVKGITDEKLYAVTFKAENNAKMSGYATQVTCTEEYDQAGTIKWHSSRFSPGITTVYVNGLEADENGNFNVWMIANPGTFSGLTVTATTENQVVTRTVNAQTTIPAQKFKEIGFNMADASVLHSNAITFDFLTAESISLPALKGQDATGPVAGSDDKEYEWTLSGKAQSYSGRGLYLPANTGAVQLPVLGSGKQLAAIRGIVDKYYNSNGAAIVLERSADNGATWETVSGTETSLDRNAFEQNNQGVFEIEIPTAEQSTANLFRIKNTTANNTYFRNLTLIWNDGTEEPPVEAKTYHEKYMAGETIEIGDLKINKENYPEATLVDIANVANKTFTDGGLVFIDGEGSYTMTESPSIHTSAIIIGNDPKKQPTIICGTNTRYFAIRGEDCDYVFKNLNIDGSSNGYIFTNNDNANATGKVKNLILEDCTIATNGNVIYDANTSNSMQNVRVNNCVIRMSDTATGKAVYGWATGNVETKATYQLTAVTLTNNVVYAPNPVSNYLVMVGGKNTNIAYDSNATIKVEHNTTYNIYHGNGVVSAYAAADIQANYNVAEFDDSTLAKNSYYVGYSKPDDPKNITVTNNYVYTNTGTTQIWKALWKNTGATATSTTKNNSFVLETSPLLSTDLATGYFPINTSVVTNGAGAAYDTKLWNTWE